MPLEILRNDITKMRTDAIVNAANNQLRQGGGVCGAIFAAAGAEELHAACKRIGSCATGEAVITEGFALPAKYVIHTVGPVWQGGQYGEAELLASCYTKSLELALEKGLESVAFPLISSGIFGYPTDQALQVAISAIGSFLLKHEMDVSLVVFDKASYALSDKLFRSIKAYVDDRYVETHTRARSARDRNDALTFENLLVEYRSCSDPAASGQPDTPEKLSRFVGRLGESFSQMLLRLIDESGKTDPEIYKRANLDRKLFSKIRSNPDYRPSKNTALALAIALELSRDRTLDLLGRAGYALSPSSRFDLIVEYFIREKIYDIFQINEALFAFDENLLGA